MNTTPFKILAIAPAMMLAACGAGEPAEPAPAETPVVAEPEEPSLPPPDKEVFAATFAKTCPNAKPVNTSICKRAGFGSSEVVCEFGLGDDEYMRHETRMVEGETEWEISDPETTCAAGA